MEPIKSGSPDSMTRPSRPSWVRRAIESTAVSKFPYPMTLGQVEPGQHTCAALGRIIMLSKLLEEEAEAVRREDDEEKVRLVKQACELS